MSFLFLPQNGQVTARDVLQMQRTAKARGVRRCILCAPCAISQEARSQAESGEIAVSFLPREELTALLGQSNPVSNAQLMALGQRRKKKKPMILNRQRARHYAAYGALLLGLYTLSGLMYYAVPGLICVGLASACRCVRSPEDSLLRG